jgi:hypothetical protein
MALSSSLDILTTRGQLSLEHENKMLFTIKEKYSVDIITTNKTKPCLCDGFTTRDNIITGLFESKCRNASLEDFKKWGSWLITYKKIDGLAWLSNKLCVPAIGLLYSIPDDTILMWEITNSEGDYLFKFNVEKTVTQETVNGGTIERENAFLPMKNAKIIS